MRYNEIITEDKQDLLINSEKRLNAMLSYGRVDLPRYTKVIIDIKKRYDIDFPKNFKINGNLYFRGWPRIISGDLTVNGHFECMNKHVNLLELKLKTDSMLLGAGVTKLPKELIVNDYLDLRNSYAYKLPDKLYVGRDLNIAFSNIIKLPNDFKIGGGLSISHTRIKELPDNLTIDGALHISGTLITKIPNNLTVNGNFYLHNTRIQELPDDLTVKDNIHIDRKKKIKMSDKLKVRIL